MRELDAKEKKRQRDANVCQFCHEEKQKFEQAKIYCNNAANHRSDNGLIKRNAQFATLTTNALL